MSRILRRLILSGLITATVAILSLGAFVVVPRLIIDHYIQQLDGQDEAQKQHATDALLRMGRMAVPSLMRAALTRDPKAEDARRPKTDGSGWLELTVAMGHNSATSPMEQHAIDCTQVLARELQILSDVERQKILPYVSGHVFSLSRSVYLIGTPVVEMHCFHLSILNNSDLIPLLEKRVPIIDGVEYHPACKETQADDP